MIYFLIGMPASGKTTVGKILAGKLRVPQIDLDDKIVERYGNIAEIFKNRGERYFRIIESEILNEAVSRDNIVVSSGGGTPLKSENVKLMRSRGKVIYLAAEIGTLLSRLGGDGSRPLLSSDTYTKLEKMLEIRTPIYERAADIRVLTDGVAPCDIADNVIKILGVL